MLPRLCPLLVIVAGTFAGSYYATSGALAHGTHCQGYGTLGCNRYYTAQWRCCGYGIQGRIKATDVSLVNPGTDYTAHWMGITSLSLPEWVQMSFTEGADPDGGSPSSPHLYTEFQRSSCSAAYGHIDHGIPGGLWDQMIVYFTGSYYACPSDPSVILYRFDMKRGSIANPALATGYLGDPYGFYEADSERGNWHAIEPNGTQCFGTNSSCSASTTYGLKACCSANQWVLWLAAPSWLSDYPYNQVVLTQWYSFYTYGQP